MMRPGWWSISMCLFALVLAGCAEKGVLPR
jgi:hypothetical protein